MISIEKLIIGDFVETITFNELNIGPEILRAVQDMGFESPTEIQAKAIPVLEETGKDFIGQAQTGTGKTAAFVIPLLNKIDDQSDKVQALILTPTRELAHQVEAEIQKIGKYKNIKSTSIYGGTSYEKQLRALKHDRPQIVVGTPGRVLDMINKKALKLADASYCVLDEADEMLNMGFLEDVQVILDKFNEQRQLIMFSATMPKSILKLIERSFNEYEMVKIAKKTLSNDSIEQKYFIVRDKYFKESLSRLIDVNPDMYGIIFCKTKLETKTVGDDLKKRGYSVEVLNGDMGQAERDHAMRNFKEKKVNIMVCTDVAARGIDVTNLTHVINYGLPQDNESYVHRIGRTGRAGMKGMAYTIIAPKMAFAIRKIEQHINGRIEHSKLPSVKELKRGIVRKAIEESMHIKASIQEKGEDFKLDKTYDQFKEHFEDLTHDELLKFMFTWKFNKVLRHYNNLSDIESAPKQSSEGRPNRRRARTAARDGERRRRFSRERGNGGNRDGNRSGSRRRRSSGKPARSSRQR